MAPFHRIWLVYQVSTSQSRESTTRKNAINCYDLDKINDQSNSRNLSLTDVEYLCAASESLSLSHQVNEFLWPDQRWWTPGFTSSTCVVRFSNTCLTFFDSGNVYEHIMFVCILVRFIWDTKIMEDYDFRLLKLILLYYKQILISVN